MDKLKDRARAAADKARLRVVEPSSWRLPKQSSSIAPPHVWTNADMDPVPPERRTWGRGAFVTYWVSDLITISTWSSGSAVVTLGKPDLAKRVSMLTSYHRSLRYRCRAHHAGCRHLQCYTDSTQRCNWCRFAHPVSDRFPSKPRILV